MAGEAPTWFVPVWFGSAALIVRVLWLAVGRAERRRKDRIVARIKSRGSTTVKVR